MSRQKTSTRKQLKTLIILVSVTILYLIYRYQGSADFFILYLNRSFNYSDAQASAQYYQWGMALFVLGFIPALIIKLGFRERVRDYGLQLRRPLMVLLIALLGIAFLTPLVYFGSKNYQFQALYPLVLNAGNSPAAFVKSAFFYFLYYVGYEFCFRGFLFMGIKDDIGDWQALGVSLIATVLLHVSQPQAEMIMAVFAGVAFPLIVKKMRTIWPVVFIHAYAGIALDYWIIMARGGFSYT
jgi:membrane protease YdiL (CAAX protease family)